MKKYIVIFVILLTSDNYLNCAAKQKEPYLCTKHPTASKVPLCICPLLATEKSNNTHKIVIDLIARWLNISQSEQLIAAPQENASFPANKLNTQNATANPAQH